MFTIFWRRCCEAELRRRNRASQTKGEGGSRQCSRQRRRHVQRPRGRVVSLTGLGDWLKEEGRLAEGVRDRAGEGGARPHRLGCVGNWGAMGGFRVREGQSALLLWAGSPDHNSATAGLTLHPRASSPGIKEHPFHTAVGHLSFLGLSPGLCRPHPRPLLPPRRWRSCWHWTRSGRSPSALLPKRLLGRPD